MEGQSRIRIEVRRPSGWSLLLSIIDSLLSHFASPLNVVAFIILRFSHVCWRQAFVLSQKADDVSPPSITTNCHMTFQPTRLNEKLPVSDMTFRSCIPRVEDNIPPFLFFHTWQTQLRQHLPQCQSYPASHLWPSAHSPIARAHICPPNLFKRFHPCVLNVPVMPDPRTRHLKLLK